MTLFLRLVVVAVVIGGLALTAGSPVLGVSAPVNVSVTSGDSTSPSIGASGRDILVVWTDTTPGGGGPLDPADIFLKRSANGGASFSTTPVNISGTASTDSHGFDWTFSGRFHHIVWTEDLSASNSDVFYRRSTNNGGAWGTKVNLSANAGISQHAAVNLAGGGLVYVAWDDDTGSAGNPEILLRRSTDGGATFDAAQNLSNTANPSEDPQLVAFGPFVYVMWTEGKSPTAGGNREVFLRRSADGGATWSAAINVSNSAGADSSRPRFTVAGRNVYVTYREVATGGETDIFVRSSNDGGLTYGGATNLSNNSAHSTIQRTLLSGPYLYVLWLDTSTTSDTLMYRRSTDAGTTWEAAKTLAGDGNDDIDDYARTLAGLFFMVVYDRQDTSTAPEDVWIRRSTDAGATFPAAVNLSSNSGRSRNEDLLATGAEVLVVWDDDTPGNREIFLLRSKNSGATFGPVQMEEAADDSGSGDVSGAGDFSGDNPTRPERCWVRAHTSAGVRTVAASCK